MSFLDWPIELNRRDGSLERRRKAVALGLIERFANTFRSVEYDLLWDATAINAQAWRLGCRQRVTVYGGLVRHPAITRSGIALILAHETGHHLGGPPRDPDLRWPTWQGQADYWAATEGMPTVFGLEAARLTLRGAKQVETLHLEVSGEDDEPDITLAERMAIFSAGAMGASAPGCLEAAFNRMLDDRKRRREV